MRPPRGRLSQAKRLRAFWPSAASRHVSCRPMAPSEGLRLGNAFIFKVASVLPLASRASETKKGQRTPSIRGARGHRAAPDLSRQSACSACLERAARTTVSAIAGALSTKRAAPATSTLEHARRAHPALISQRSGPRQRPLRRQSFLALNPGGSAGRGRKP